MVIGHHLIWTGYGQWLPNDPRGSMSRELRNPVIEELGEIHFGRKRIQPCGAEIRKFYAAASPKLQYPVLNFTPEQIGIIASAFGEVIAAQRYTVWACAIMPDHVHVLVRKHRDHAERMIANLQRQSRHAPDSAPGRSRRPPDLGRARMEGFSGLPRRRQPDRPIY